MALRYVSPAEGVVVGKAGAVVAEGVVVGKAGAVVAEVAQGVEVEGRREVILAPEAAAAEGAAAARARVLVTRAVGAEGEVAVDELARSGSTTPK